MDFSKIDIKDLACFIYEFLKGNGIEVILVGGACVSIYTENQYQSYDLDFVVFEEIKRIQSVLEKIGFKRVGRCFSHKDCPYVIDFVNPPVAIGNEAIRKFEILKTTTGNLKLLSATDCVKDRLAAFFHWNDLQTLEQAILVAKENSVDYQEISRWAESEGHKEKLNYFLNRIS